MIKRKILVEIPRTVGKETPALGMDGSVVA